MSSLISIVGGFLLALSFLNKKSHKILQLWLWLALLPNFLPVILVLLSTMSFFYWFGLSFQGLWAIVFVHALINMGLVAHNLYRSINHKALASLELVYVEGASLRQWLWPVIKLLKDDILASFIFVFFICFASFSVPLILGNGLSTTLEVFIYEQIKIYKDWSTVSSLLIIELLALFILSTLGWKQDYKAIKEIRETKLWNFNHYKFFLFLPLTIVLSGWMVESLRGWNELYRLADYHSEILSSIPWTIFISLGVALLITGFLLLIAWVYPLKYLGKFLFGVGAPSTVLIGYSLVSWEFSNAYFSSALLIILALTLIFLPPLYRLYIATDFNDLHELVFMAESLGASRKLIYSKIIIPILFPKIISCAQLAALWACGEFALSSIIADNSFSLALIIKDLLQGYHLALAAILMWVILFIGCAIYFLLTGVESVIS
ncbi:MAG: hypothetical protein KDD40_11070, partial [Bdellovibrionales bacterium]|nr:hypothetical protein [Bdellovibrionales bacterium]